MKLSPRLFLAISLVAGIALAQSASVPPAPATEKRPVTDEYFGVKVTENYRWLENWDDPHVKQWNAAENARTRAYLDRLAVRPALAKVIRDYVSASSDAYYRLIFRGGTLFAMKYHPPQQQSMIVALPSADQPAKARVIFDPNTADAKGSTSVDFYVPSLDGKYVAAAISENGSEDSSAHIFETATGRELPDRVPRVNFATAGGSLDWKADGSGFYYTRLPQGNERPPEDVNFYQQVYFHRLGTDAKQDVYVIGKDFPRIAEIALHTSADGRWLVATVANGDGGQYEHFVMDASGHWAQVTHFEDGIASAKAGPDGYLYMLSHKNALRGQILRVPLDHPDLAVATVIVPQSSGAGADEAAHAAIEDFLPTPGHLYVTDIIGGPSRLRVFDYDGHALTSPALAGVAAVEHIESLGNGAVLFYKAGYLDPPAWYRFDPATGQTTRTALFETSPVNLDNAEVVREFATSKDGTRVPMDIIRRKGTKLDGTNPTLLYGYGGYGVNEKPYFMGWLADTWLAQGGVFASAILRGGGEYGEEWHRAGNLTHKQHVFDDFIACAQHLVESNQTSPAHLAIMGGSNGGLLMGATLTQRPDLFRAVVSYVGIYDMLRVELDPNGTFNVTEFGSVKDPEQFRALYAYSPYHHVKDGTDYPAILFLTGENDHRVNPMESRKMIARLQAANHSRYPILLRTTSNAGHGFGTALDEQIAEEADVFSFLYDQLGMRFAAPAR